MAPQRQGNWRWNRAARATNGSTWWDREWSSGKNWPVEEAAHKALLNQNKQLREALAAAKEKQKGKGKGKEGGAGTPVMEPTKEEAIQNPETNKPNPKMINSKGQTVEVAWTCHICAQQHWSKGKRRCYNCNAEKDPDAWSLVTMGQGPPAKSPQAVPECLWDNRKFLFEAFGEDLEETLGGQREARTASSNGSAVKEDEPMEPAQGDTQEGKPTLESVRTNLEKAKQAHQLLVGMKAVDSLIRESTKNVQNLEKEYSKLDVAKQVNIGDPLRCSERVNQMLADLHDHRNCQKSKQVTKLASMREVQEKIQQQIKKQEETMEEEERTHQAVKTKLEAALTKATANVVAKGLIKPPQNAVQDLTETQILHKNCQTVFDLAQKDAYLNAPIEPGTTAMDIVSYVLKGQITNALEREIAEEQRKQEEKEEEETKAKQAEAIQRPVDGGSKKTPVALS